MAFTLEAKAGDTQALKAIISAKASDSSVNLAIVAEAPANIFRSPSIRLVLSDQTTLTEPNAVATYLSGMCLPMCKTPAAFDHLLVTPGVTSMHVRNRSAQQVTV